MTAAPLDVDPFLRPWLDQLRADAGPLALYDAHTHIGRNDPDGFRQEPDELLAALGAADARGIVFAMHEPGGYRAANDVALGAADGSGGRLVAFCRVDPRDGAAAEAVRCLDAGARGVKLHPRAEGFTLREPGVREVVAVAHERRVPVLIHAGRGIPALGEDAVRLSAEYPGARLILAHCAISDLAWLWRVLPEHPNLFVDTAWWNPVDIVALFTLAPPGHILWASDSPYGRPLPSAVAALRCARQAGLSDVQLRSVAGGQLERLLAGQEPADLGPAPGVVRPLDPLLERVVSHLVGGLNRAFAGGSPEEPLALARLACAVGGDAPQAAVCAAVLELLDLFEDHLAPPPDGRPIPLSGRFFTTALAVARTPDVPLPARPGAPEPIRASAE